MSICAWGDNILISIFFCCSKWIPLHWLINYLQKMSHTELQNWVCPTTGGGSILRMPAFTVSVFLVCASVWFRVDLAPGPLVKACCCALWLLCMFIICLMSLLVIDRMNGVSLRFLFWTLELLCHLLKVLTVVKKKKCNLLINLELSATWRLS